MIEKISKNIDCNEKMDKSMASPKLDLESFWIDNEKAIKESLESYLKEYIFKSIDNEYYKIKLNEILLCEKEFSKVLLESLEKSLESNKKIAMLFDVDDTIGKALFSPNYNEEGFRTFIRPSFLLFLKKIKNLIDSGRVDIGLLTTRGTLKEQLENKDHLLSIKQYINPGYLYSTHIDSLKYRNFDEIKNEVENDKDNVLDPKIVKKIGYTHSSGTFKKMILLKDIKTSHPDTLFIVVDDIDYPKCLDEKKGLVGVALGGKTAFYG